MSGEYEEAQLIGYITSAAGADKVVLVVYHRRGAGGARQSAGIFGDEEEEELVPLSLIRTLAREKVWLFDWLVCVCARARMYHRALWLVCRSLVGCALWLYGLWRNGVLACVLFTANPLSYEPCQRCW